MIDAWPTTINACDFTSGDLVDTIRDHLGNRHSAFVQNFPTELSALTRLLKEFGNPLPFYGARATEGTHPDDVTVHRVRYDADAANRGELHALDMELPLHSAQSQRDPRPRYFAMLMISPGLSASREGSNGQSHLAFWRTAARFLDARTPGAWAECARLLSESVPIGGTLIRPMIYPLEDAADVYDVGVRMKYGLLQQWKAANMRDAHVAALEALLAAANEPEVRLERQLIGGDLLIIDNNRAAHGRRAFPGRSAGNVRELWSVTLA